MASACGECKKKYNKIARFLAEGGGVFSFECLGLSSSASLGVLGSLCGSMRWPVVRDPCPVGMTKSNPCSFRVNPCLKRSYQRSSAFICGSI